MKAAILTYHSHRVAGCNTDSNDHVALAADLEALNAAGARFVSLDDLVAGLFLGGKLPQGRLLICLTFDDGCDSDFRNVEFSGHGRQNGFLQIMKAFVQRHGVEAQPGLHATSFVIANRQARQRIDRKSLSGQGLMNDDWWCEADAHPLMSVANHGWDHVLPNPQPNEDDSAPCSSVEKLDYFQQQIDVAGQFIESKTGRYPDYFAYPFGESTSFVRHEYFPNWFLSHRTVAAVGTEPALVSSSSYRWNLPRFVCGRDWKNPEGLLKMVLD